VVCPRFFSKLEAELAGERVRVELVAEFAV
jgi:hypothetical protein